MKQLSMIIISSFLFLLASCVTEKSKNSSTENISAYCYQGSNYYTMPGCPGYSGGTTATTSGSTGGTSGNCSGNNYYTYPGCAGFCAYYPTHASCANGGTNPYPKYPSDSVPSTWGVKYPKGIPAGTCSSAYAPSGITYTPYETRKATMMVAGKTWYNPASGVAYTNTSSILMNVASARTLFETDAVLKVRFKVLSQPESSNASPYCAGRMSGSPIPGYTKLEYNVQLVGVRSNGTVETNPIGTFLTGVNSCSQAIDLSTYASRYPGGIYITVGSVRSNQGPVEWDYWTYGFNNSTSFTDVRSSDCWVLDVEVAADGTKTFN